MKRTVALCTIAFALGAAIEALTIGAWRAEHAYREGRADGAIAQQSAQLDSSYAAFREKYPAR